VKQLACIWHVGSPFIGRLRLPNGAMPGSRGDETPGARPGGPIVKGQREIRGCVLFTTPYAQLREAVVEASQALLT
jgi:hypothetical protein